METLLSLAIPILIGLGTYEFFSKGMKAMVVTLAIGVAIIFVLAFCLSKGQEECENISKISRSHHPKA